MNIISAYFSPTGTTKKITWTVAEAIHRSLRGSSVSRRDFTLPQARQAPLEFLAGDIVVLGMPVYAGRVPNLLLPYLNSLAGSGAIGLPIAVYGNRHFDYALIELSELMKQAGLRVIGGGAFIGEHSFSKVLAKDRPDDNDLAIARRFGEAIAEKIRRNDLSHVKLPGDENDQAYYQPKAQAGDPIDIRPVKPVTDKVRCIDCRLCAKRCPLGSIDFEDVSKTPGICMKCGSCIKGCPTQAKFFNDPGYLYHKTNLEETYTARKEPVYLL